MHAVTALIFTTGHLIVSIYNYLRPLHIPCLLCPQQVPQLILILSCQDKSNIPEVSQPLAVLSESSCSFPLTLITGHGSTETC